MEVRSMYKKNSRSNKKKIIHRLIEQDVENLENEKQNDKMIFSFGR